MYLSSLSALIGGCAFRLACKLRKFVVQVPLPNATVNLPEELCALARVERASVSDLAFGLNLVILAIYLVRLCNRAVRVRMWLIAVVLVGYLSGKTGALPEF